MLIWIISHVGIYDNNKVEIYAKRAISSPDSIQAKE